VEALRTVDRLSRVEQRIRCNCGDADAETVGKQRQQAGSSQTSSVRPERRHDTSSRWRPPNRAATHDPRRGRLCWPEPHWGSAPMRTSETDYGQAARRYCHLDEVWSLTARRDPDVCECPGGEPVLAIDPNGLRSEAVVPRVLEAAQVAAQLSSSNLNSPRLLFIRSINGPRAWKESTPSVCLRDSHCRHRTARQRCGRSFLLYAPYILFEHAPHVTVK
jgi:hypothetical protein